MERSDRISEEIRKELSDMFRNQIKDPRFPEFVSVTAVRVTRDLRYAKAYISVYGDEEQKSNALTILTNASGFIRHEIGRRISMRYTPEFTFILDDSIEKGMELRRFIEETVKPDDADAQED